MRVESGGQAVGDKEGSFLLKQKILKSFFKYTQEIDSNITTIKQTGHLSASHLTIRLPFFAVLYLCA